MFAVKSALGREDNDWIFIFSSSVSLMGNTNLATFPQYINACGFGITSSTVTYRINAWASSNCGSSQIQTYKCKRVTVTHNWWEYLHFLFYDTLTYASESFSIRLKLKHAMRQNVQRENTNSPKPSNGHGQREIRRARTARLTGKIQVLIKRHIHLLKAPGEIQAGGGSSRTPVWVALATCFDQV